MPTWKGKHVRSDRAKIEEEIAATKKLQILNIFGRKMDKNLTNRHAGHKPGNRISVLNCVKCL